MVEMTTIQGSRLERGAFVRCPVRCSLRIFEDREYHSQPHEQSHAGTQTAFPSPGTIMDFIPAGALVAALEFSRRTAPFPKIVHCSPPSSRTPRYSSALPPEANSGFLDRKRDH